MGSAFIATSAAALFESVPFILAAALVAQLPFARASRLVPYLGCGCGAGPSAVSLPAAAVTALLFGPAAAVVRLAAGIAVRRALNGARFCSGAHAPPAAQLFALLPSACCAALGALFSPMLLGMHAGNVPQFAAGLFAGFIGAPCALGAVTFAAALHGPYPFFAAGFLCVAGIADARALFSGGSHAHPEHDAFAYLLLAGACGIAGLRGGAQLVHPSLGVLLLAGACACAAYAIRHRTARCARLRAAPALMLCGALIAAPPPPYHATETSLAQAFAGERVDFTGMATQTGLATTLVRYAITCCRADAAPVVIRLQRARPQLRGWVRARGVLRMRDGSLALDAASLQAIAPPSDPFVYR
ncbi:MAG: hypothetical protein ABR508_04775 [Candidatus Baltobacteraceae bacterium]